MVTKGHRVELELIECLADLLSAVERVEERSLKLVADVQPEAIVVLGTLLVDHCFDTGITTVAAAFGLCAICSGRAELVKMSVNIVDVEEG
jgi:hypothetical protein